MIVVQEEKKEFEGFLPKEYGLPEDAVFFDIETTGLSSHSAMLYLLGVLFRKEGRVHMIQWFAESFSDEQAILKAFFDFISGYTTLVSFNGENFDLRFLKKTAEQYHLAHSLDEKTSVDLYKRIRKTGKLTRITSFKLKQIEAYLGISREDKYTGLELISVYNSYQKKPSKEKLRLLLQHNSDDIEGLIRILPMLTLYELIEGPCFQTVSLDTFGSEDAPCIRGIIKHTLPAPVHYTFSNGNRLSVDADRFTLELLPLKGTLRRYYSEYRSYSFLPAEGYAIHNKLAAFVESSHKIPATPETCFTLHEDLFVPAPGKKYDGIVFREAYNSKPYIQLKQIDVDSYIRTQFLELQ